MNGENVIVNCMNGKMSLMLKSITWFSNLNIILKKNIFILKYFYMSGCYVCIYVYVPYT